MKRNRIAAGIALLLIVLAPLQLGSQETIRLKIASIAPNRSPWDIELRALAQEWFAITKGQVSVTFYDTESLGGERGVIQKFRSVRPGQKAPLDGAIFSTIGLHELAPSAGIYTLSLPFLIRNQQELDLVLERFGPELSAEFRKAGFEMVAWTNVGWLSFYTKDRFSNLSELKRIKISSAGLDSPILGDSFRAAGFSIEDISSTKLLQSLKSAGGVRGFFGVHMFAYVAGASKNISYCLDTKLAPVMAGLVITSDTWAKIPAEYKPAMMDAVNRMRVRLNASLEQTDRQYVENMKKEGVTMIVPDKTELAAWETEFSRDIDSVSRSNPGIYSQSLYGKIRDLLRTVRK